MGDKKKQKQFRVVGIDGGNGKLSTYAAKIEKVLNALTKDGYEIRVIDNSKKRGVVVTAELREPHPSLPATFLEAMRSIGAVPLSMVTTPESGTAPQEGGKPEHPHTAGICRALKQRLDVVPPPHWEGAVKALMKSVSQQFTPSDCVAIANDLMNIAKRHDENHNHGSDGDCDTSKIYRQAAGILRDVGAPRIN